MSPLLSVCWFQDLHLALGKSEQYLCTPVTLPGQQLKPPSQDKLTANCCFF